MQYILSEEERANLRPLEIVIDLKDALKIARNDLLKMADFTCIHDDPNYDAVCDSCPCSPIGIERDYKVYSAICGLTTIYSK